jgi:hypothetical protein
MKAWALLVLFGWVASADAAEELSICYNYGCLAQARITYSNAQLAWVHARLATARDPAAERAMLAEVIGRLYAWAGRQSPIWRDRGGDYADDVADGRMDCIDHATSTTRLLRMIEARGWLKHHRVLDQVMRSFLILQHFSAAIEEVVATADRQRHGTVQPAGAERVSAQFVVDSWFFDNGAAPLIMPLDEWKRGGGPHV